MRREFLQLADTYSPAKHKIGGFFISEKLDGSRCLYDGGITRGMRTVDVPWASTRDPKTGKLKAKIKPISTGLWSRYGNPIMAPDWFLNQLPCCPLDGELWAGRGNFQLCRSICAGDEPDPRFNQIQYAVYSTPSLESLFADGEIKNANMLCTIDKTVHDFVSQRLSIFGNDYYSLPAGSDFSTELMFLREHIEAQNDHCFLHRQIKLHEDETLAREQANEFLESILDWGGEGCVMRDPLAKWVPKRHKGLLKYKPYEDAEGEVIGYVCGKEGKQGNVLGKIGALIVRTKGFDKNVEFEIGSGMTFEDREFATAEMSRAAACQPGEEDIDLPILVDGKRIKRGQTITFKYRELSDDGIPKEARFFRKRDGVE